MIHREVCNKSILETWANPAQTDRLINPELFSAGELFTHPILVYQEPELHRGPVRRQGQASHREIQNFLWESYLEH